MISIAVVCEDMPDRDTVAALADRVICNESPQWVIDTIEYLREYRGYTRVDAFLKLTAVNPLAKSKGIVSAGFVNGLPANKGAHTAMRALRLLDKSSDRPDAVILCWDSDGESDRLAGLEQARDHAAPKHVPVVIAHPRTKRECWHIVGFEPRDEDEQERIDRLRQELGTDPRRYSHELTAAHDAANDTRSAKRVLAELTAGDRDREAACLQTSLATLRDRGRENGLKDFLEDIETRLVPLFTDRPTSAE